MFGLKNLFALVGLVLVAFVVAGWYLGWYKFGEQTDAQGHPQLQIQVNPLQVKSDLEKAKEKIIQGVENHQVNLGQPPATTPGLPNGVPSAPPPPPPSFQMPVPPSIPSNPLQSQPPQAQIPQPPADSWIYPPK